MGETVPLFAEFLRLRLMRNQISPPIKPTPTNVAATAIPAVAPVESPPPLWLLVATGSDAGIVGVTVVVAAADVVVKDPSPDAIVSKTLLV